MEKKAVKIQLWITGKVVGNKGDLRIHGMTPIVSNIFVSFEVTKLILHKIKSYNQALELFTHHNSVWLNQSPLLNLILKQLTLMKVFTTGPL